MGIQSSLHFIMLYWDIRVKVMSTMISFNLCHRTKHRLLLSDQIFLLNPKWTPALCLQQVFLRVADSLYKQTGDLLETPVCWLFFLKGWKSLSSSVLVTLIDRRILWEKKKEKQIESVRKKMWARAKKTHYDYNLNHCTMEQIYKETWQGFWGN